MPLSKRVLYIPFLLFSFFLFCLPVDSFPESPESLLGVSLEQIRNGSYGSALEILKGLEKTIPDNFELYYNLGLAYKGLERYPEAENAFKRAISIAPDVEETYLQIADLLVRTGRCDEASDYIATLRKRSDDEILLKFADELEKGCRRKGKPYYISVELGGQYDSNVILEPTIPLASTEKKEDYRAYLFLDAGGSLPVGKGLTLSGSYDLYQSIHNALHDFDVRSHDLSVGLNYEISRYVSAGMDYSLVYTKVGEELYSRLHRLGGTVEIDWKEGLNQGIFYYYTDTRYWESPVFQGNAGRSGYEQMAGTYLSYSTARFGSEIGGYWKGVDADKSFWEYDGFGVYGQVSFSSGGFTLLLGAEYETNDYGNEFPGLGVKREDRRQRYSGEVRYAVSRNLSVIGGYSYTYNDSNIELFEYERNIASLILKVGIP